MAAKKGSEAASTAAMSFNVPMNCDKVFALPAVSGHLFRRDAPSGATRANE
ncbi:hypothetical protein [Acidovorax sp. WCS2018Noco2-12]|uniref:hypothetical protein n=1 Tax=Acidovorax sp. WCS2018Noco2-12 TaxID=3073623 RepID=UPI002883549A|nr:hypothetical protein [Acidovorax sp. WCS2018Noco2-12]